MREVYAPLTQSVRAGKETSSWSRRTLLEALTTFETVGMPVRNIAVRTCHEYSRDLRELLTYLATCGISSLDMVRLPALEGYLAELDRRGLQGSSRNRKTHTIKSFFKCLLSQELLVVNPAAQLVAPRAIKKEPRFLS